MEDKVISDVMNGVFLPQGRYPKNFVLISFLEVCQEGEGVSGRVVPGGHLGFLTRDMEDRVIHDILDDINRLQESYHECVFSLSLFLTLHS